MASHVLSRRIQLLIQYVYDTYFPSKIQIIEFLKERDFRVSTRTIERDFDRIRADYGLEVSYDKSKSGYYIDEEASIKVSSFFKFLEIVSVADIFTESLKSSKKILQYVDFEDSHSFKGIENLKTLLLAISQNRLISFIHENYSKNTLTKYTITPLLLKEYENRWYVIGVPGDINDIRTFGIDRITKLETKGLSKKSKVQYMDRLAKFGNIIGLHYEDNHPVKVRLLVEGLHIKYMQSLPLHHSQVIHSENEKGQFLVDFFLVPNYEFIAQILKIGPEAIVVYPNSLKNEIKELLQKSINRYN